MYHPNQLFRLIYLSRNTGTFSVSKAQQIITVSESNNKDRQLTGMLLYANNHYLQMLEGYVLEINEIYEQIARDERHDKIALLGMNHADKRIFPEWQMRFANLDEIKIPKQVQEEGKSPYAPFPMSYDGALEIFIWMKFCHLLKN